MRKFVETSTNEVLKSERSPGRDLPYLVRISDAASITGLPASLIRKSFMSEAKKPANVPEPPPPKRMGKAIYIIADRLEDRGRIVRGTAAEAES